MDKEKNVMDVPVVLPCTIEHFRDFVSGLLGQPQEIEGGEFGPFSISKDDIEQIYHLITQRIHQQHDVLPIGLAIRVVYDDGTSIQLNSFADFQSFNEVKPVVSTEAHVSLTYLIQFPQKKSPEEQVITVSFVSTKRPKTIRQHLPFFAGNGFSLLARGYISYQIKYTARTWGADIEGLIKNHINNLIHQESQLRKFIRSNSLAIGIVAGVVLFGLFYYGQSLVVERLLSGYLQEISPYLGGKVPVSDKLDVLLKIMTSESFGSLSRLSERYLIVSFVISLIFVFYVEDKADNRKPSFVVLTKKSQEEKEIVERKYNKTWIKFWVSLAGAVVMGVASNFVYEFFARKAIVDLIPV